MAESLLDMEKLEHLINLEERLRLHPNLKAIYDTVMYELLDVNKACVEKVEARKKKEQEEAYAKAKEESDRQAKAQAEANAKSQAAQAAQDKQNTPNVQPTQPTHSSYIAR